MTGVQTCALPICFPVTIGEEDIAESEARVDEIIAKIPSEKQQYYIGKAHEEALKASKLLTEAAAAKTDEERKVWQYSNMYYLRNSRRWLPKSKE